MKNDVTLTQKKQRVEYIDCAKFIGIFLLLIEHTGNWTDLSSGGGIRHLKVMDLFIPYATVFHCIRHGVKL